MQLDASSFPDGTTLEADVCIVGAGPAGLVLASELAGDGTDVVLLESGADLAEAEVLALNDGDVVGDAYAGLGRTRHRQIGGASCMWNTPVPGGVGAKYAPLDPVDLEERPWPSPSGWPVPYPELRRYYERAQRTCGLGPLA